MYQCIHLECSKQIPGHQKHGKIELLGLSINFSFYLSVSLMAIYSNPETEGWYALVAKPPETFSAELHLCPFALG